MEIGRRERNKQEKLARIRRAAGELFAERGHEAVTTQEIADRADVGAGTLFRYASTKAELLLMVYNDRFRAALAEGKRAATGSTPRDRVLALLAPIVRSNHEQLANGRVYQRELMFGDATERYRAEGLALVADLQNAIAAAIDRPGESEERARVVFAIFHLAVATAALDDLPVDETLDDIAAQLAVVTS
ncbi:TetR/AcrR family transcriptional regulator [Cryptosporangium aurantiacum]|uniref:Transcriptional regulator, TetR family n=1 Tax=Cryptosporangium aurantiacum TaxID=134849 RepID=A0A1M7RL11_9ACTN|nr:TetR/AcrR family transcriptional regulator [Cryptosporangium aurantiacum]SHN47003.1 transcriptional regulator, TetR family [Cryptosporangium aurantiacum]